VSTLRIVVFGGSGFVGRHLVARFAAEGHCVTVPTRRRESGQHLILLPTVDVVEADVHDAKTRTRLCADADAVVNLVGILNESGRNSFARTHVELTRGIVEACRGAGVQRLVQMSALGADVAGPSQYQRTKGEAEAIVADSPLAWTIFRPSVIFGREDAFLNLFARLMRLLPVMALAAPDARFQPVYVGDVATCFAQATLGRTMPGQRFELCGPTVYTLRELVRYVGRLTGAERAIIPLGPFLSRWQAMVLEHLPGKLMSRDNLASMTRDNVCGCPFPAVFGIAPTPLEAVAPEYLAPAAQRSAFDGFRASGGR
jgi:NADH dehydrogenase